VLALALALACLVAGCWNPFGPGDKKHKDDNTPPLMPARTSPENVLFNLRVIYGDKDNIVDTAEDAHTLAQSYRTLFHPDTFTFYFVTGDQPPGFPNPWWFLNDEVAGFDSLLTKRAAGIVDDVKLSWTVNPSEPDNRTGPQPPELLHPTWRHIYVTGILLDVVMGDNTWRVANGTTDFYFAPDPADSTLWVITEWYDHQPLGSPPGPVSLTAPNTETWGAIKGLFR
jgi:hypothetical protein